MTFFRKKYYREVPCKACDGSGYFRPTENDLKKDMNEIEKLWAPIALKLWVKPCLECSGKGTQTVLERIE